jgi:uncharacterized protein YecE (DUF72 family)
MGSYFKRFGAVEIQQTFYSLPRIDTASRWARAAPEGFIFTMKAWQGITHDASSPTWKKSKMPPGFDLSRFGHFRPTDEVFAAWDATRKFARELGASFIVIQSPRFFGMSAQNEVNLESFFTTIERGGLTIGWEPRGTWSDDQTRLRRIFSRLNIVHIVDPFWDIPLSDLPLSYFKLHGRGKRLTYRSDYTDDNLHDLAKLTVERSKLGPIYIMFNVVEMRNIADRFLDLLDEVAPGSAG